MRSPSQRRTGISSPAYCLTSRWKKKILISLATEISTSIIIRRLTLDSIPTIAFSTVTTRNNAKLRTT